MRITPKRKLQKAQAEYSKAKGTHYKHKQAAEKAALAVKKKFAARITRAYKAMVRAERKRDDARIALSDAERAVKKAQR